MEDNKILLAQYFEQCVAQTPLRTACVAGDETISYEALNRRANQLAIYFQEQGMVPHTLVAIWGERSIQTIITMLAVIKAGGVYAWLDPRDPFIRQEKILRDLQPGYIVSIHDPKLSLPKVGSRLLFLEDLNEQLNQYDSENSHISVDNAPLATVVYQSDPIGVPVGVLIDQAAIIYLVKQQHYLQFEPHHTMFHLSRLGDDLAIFEIWGALLNGGTLVIVDDTTRNDVRLLAETIQQYQNGVVLLSDSEGNAMAAQMPNLFNNLDYLLLRGDWVEVAAIEKMEWPRHVLHVWGEAACGIFVTYQEIKKDRPATSVSLGQTLNETSIFIKPHFAEADEMVVKFTTPAREETIGEICVSGEGIARGYLNRLDLTHKRFRERNGKRFYRTRCIGKRLSDGNIIFFERKGYINIEGQWVATKEIERNLEEAPDVERAIVWQGENEQNQKKMLVFLTPNKNTVRVFYNGTCQVKWEDNSVETVKVKDISKGGLCIIGTVRKTVYREPVALILSDSTGREEIPAEAVWQTDKTVGIRFMKNAPLIEKYIDRSFSGKCEVIKQKRHYAKVLEKKLPSYMIPVHSIVISNIPLLKNGMRDDARLKSFFLSEEEKLDKHEESNDIKFWKEHIASQIKGERYVKTEGETVSKLSEKIMQRLVNNYFVIGSNRDLFGNALLSQLTLMIAKTLDQSEKDPIFTISRNKTAPLSVGQKDKLLYENVAIRGFLKGVISYNLIKRAYMALCERHEILKTIYLYDQNGHPYQKINSDQKIDFSIIDNREALSERIARPFNITSGPLVRGILLREASLESELVLVFHRSIVDVRSLEIATRDFLHFYAIERKETNEKLPELPIQYIDYSAWESEKLRAINRMEEKNIPLPALPYDFEKPTVLSCRVEHCVFSVPANLTSALKGYSINLQSTLNMLLLASYFSFLNKKINSNDIFMEIMLPNRDRLEVENVMGVFENMVRIRINEKEKVPFKKIVETVRSAVLEAYLQQDILSNTMVRKKGPLLFSYGKENGFDVVRSTYSPYELSLIIREKENHLEGSFAFSVELFKAETIAKWRDEWLFGLQQISANRNVKFDEIYSHTN